MSVRGWVIAGTIVAGGLLSVGSVAQPAGARPAPHREVREAPIVVELFTAQGCASCIEANVAVEAAAAEPGVIALTYGVDYWDYLGWSDTFARPKFTERQRAYRSALRLRNVSTPQVVIGGYRQVSGARAPELEAVISEEAARPLYPPQIEFRASGDAVGVGSGRVPAGGAEVLAVTYVPGSQVVDVAGGDNRGRSVRHVNVVRDIVRLGDWSGRPRLYQLPDALQEGEAVVVLVQDKRDRRIIGAAARD